MTERDPYPKLTANVMTSGGQPLTEEILVAGLDAMARQRDDGGHTHFLTTRSWPRCIYCSKVVA